MRHEISIEPCESTTWQTAAQRRAKAVRWRCSCGRVGPDVLKRERARAERGGAQHVARVSMKPVRRHPTGRCPVGAGRVPRGAWPG
jgi:hypothetical protein